MSKKGFDIGAFAASLSETVSKLDTHAEPQLQYIDIDQLDAHEANFYDVSNLDTLADSIAMDGLQQPIVVTAGEGGRYTVLSGHRRRAALRKLVEEDGREDLRRVPCLVRVYQSQALAELQLIMANSTARVLTAAEVMHQAQRMEELLYQLKKEGYSFPGRMRAQVAEACQVSESKLARLKVIRDKLIDSWMDRFEAGDISEDVAYTIAQMKQDYQTSLGKIFGGSGYSISKNVVEYYRHHLEGIAAIECAGGAACTNRERMIEHTAKDASPYFGTCKTCCASCNSKSTCEHICPMVAEQVAQEAKARQLELEETEKRRAEAAAERAAWEAEEVKSNLEQWQRLGQEFDRLGMTPEDVASLWSDGPTSSMVAALASLLAGERPDNENIFGLDLGYEICDSLMVDDLVGAGVSLDFVITGKRPETAQDGQWQRGSPTVNGLYWVIEEDRTGELLRWQDDHWEYPDLAIRIDPKVVACMLCGRLPSWVNLERKEV